MICQQCRRAAPPLGSLVVDELIFPVVDVHLAAGAFRTVAYLRGPMRAGDTTDYVLLDREGRAVYRSCGRNRVAWPALAAGGGDVMITSDFHVAAVV